MADPVTLANQAPPRPLPAFFCASRALAGLQTVALACAMSAMAGAAFAYLSRRLTIGLVAAVPTLLMSFVWLAFVRLHPRFGLARGRLRWLSSVPLAVANGALAGGFFCATFGWFHVPSTFFGGAMLGATYGIVYWAPGLLLTLLFVGVPLRYAERQAARLGGHDRGGRVLGITALALTVFAAISLWYVDSSNHVTHFTELSAAGAWMERCAAVFFDAVIAVAVVLAVVVIVSATVRETQRAAFLRRAESGRIPHYRIDMSAAGRVLVRLEDAREPYRAAAVPTSALLLDD